MGSLISYKRNSDEYETIKPTKICINPENIEAR